MGFPFNGLNKRLFRHLICTTIGDRQIRQGIDQLRVNTVLEKDSQIERHWQIRRQPRILARQRQQPQG
jgi:hypothetical protein